MIDNIDLSKAHLYTQSIFNSALIAHKDNGYIYEKIKMFYPNASFPIIYRQDNSQVLCYTADDMMFIILNGTDGTWSDWKNNFDAKVNRYFHRGIANEYFNTDLSPFVMKFAEKAIKEQKQIKLFGHSQGDSEACLGCLQIAEKYPKVNIEAIVSCGTRLCTNAGITRMKKAGCRITHLFNHGDIVSMVGGIVKLFPLTLARHYGYCVKLPDYRQWWPIYSHAWSQVMYGLYALYNSWKDGEKHKEILKKVIRSKVAKK